MKLIKNMISKRWLRKNTELISCDSKSSVTKAINVLRNGGVIIYPTESSYAIGADSTNIKAVNEVYKIKKRDKSIKMPVIMSDMDMIGENLEIDSDSRNLIKKFMPGPLTLICTKKDSSNIITSHDNIAFRILEIHLQKK